MNLPTPRVVDEQAPVDLRGLRADATLEEVLGLLARAFDDGLERAAAEGEILPARDRALEGEQEFPPLLLLIGPDRVSQRL